MTERMTMAKHDTTVLQPHQRCVLPLSSQETDQLQALNADTTGFILSKDQSELRLRDMACEKLLGQGLWLSKTSSQCCQAPSRRTQDRM